jgi:hypothetical protein
VKWFLSFSPKLFVAISCLGMSIVCSANDVVNDANSLVLEVHLDQYIIAESLSAYSFHDETYLPLKDFCRILNFSVDVDYSHKVAKGWMIQVDRKFLIDIAKGQVLFDGKKQSFDASLIASGDSDFYIPIQLLMRWFPVNMDVDTSNLILNVIPREKLPLQSQLERIRLGSLIQNTDESSVEDPGYPAVDIPYKLIDRPFIDQRIGTDFTRSNQSIENSYTYSTSLSSDFLGMESALYVSGSKGDFFDSQSLIMSRTDPDARLLGRLRAREFAFGSVPIPGQSEIVGVTNAGVGVLVSNRPFDQPSRFDSHRLRGVLLPGWDVIVYHNGVPVGFQQGRSDGRYEFERLPLIFGYNDYQLVFHGPLGEERETHERFFLNNSLVRPGEFNYDFGMNTMSGKRRLSLVTDKSVGKNTTVAANFFQVPIVGERSFFFNGGIRTFWPSFFVSGDVIVPSSSGRLITTAVNTHVGGMMIGLKHYLFRDFVSEIFPFSTDPFRSRTKARLDFSLPFSTRLPVALEATHDIFSSGAVNDTGLAKISTYFLQTSFSAENRFQLNRRDLVADSSLIASRRVNAFNVRGLANFSTAPLTRFNSIELEADTRINDVYQLNQSLGRNLDSQQFTYGLALNKNIGTYAFGASLTKNSQGELTFGLNFFIGAALDARKPGVFVDALPMANTGAVSARVFWDKNENGIMDDGDEPTKGVKFHATGLDIAEKTDKDGIVSIMRLPVRQNINLGINASSIEDIQLTPKIRGIRLSPRPGRVYLAEFPLIKSIEIDGIVYLKKKKMEEPAGDVELELVTLTDPPQIISKVTTASDGFYVMGQVPIGDFKIRIAPEQAERLKIRLLGSKEIHVRSSEVFMNNHHLYIIQGSAPK